MNSGIIMNSKDSYALEQLAREEAWLRFLQNVMQTCIIWQIDENVRKNLESPKQWITKRVEQLERVVNG